MVTVDNRSAVSLTLISCLCCVGGCRPTEKSEIRSVRENATDAQPSERASSKPSVRTRNAKALLSNETIQALRDWSHAAWAFQKDYVELMITAKTADRLNKLETSSIQAAQRMISIESQAGARARRLNDVESNTSRHITTLGGLTTPVVSLVNAKVRALRDESNAKIAGIERRLTVLELARTEHKGETQTATELLDRLEKEVLGERGIKVTANQLSSEMYGGTLIDKRVEDFVKGWKGENVVANNISNVKEDVGQLWGLILGLLIAFTGVVGYLVHRLDALANEVKKDRSVGAGAQNGQQAQDPLGGA